MSEKPIALTPPREGYAEAWPDAEFVQQPAAQLPWGICQSGSEQIVPELHVGET